MAGKIILFPPKKKPSQSRSISSMQLAPTGRRVELAPPPEDAEGEAVNEAWQMIVDLAGIEGPQYKQRLSMAYRSWRILRHDPEYEAQPLVLARSLAKGFGVLAPFDGGYEEYLAQVDSPAALVDLVEEDQESAAATGIGALDADGTDPVVVKTTAAAAAEAVANAQPQGYLVLTVAQRLRAIYDGTVDKAKKYAKKTFLETATSTVTSPPVIAGVAVVAAVLYMARARKRK